MKTKITFYSGIHTIGGVIMAVQYGKERVLLEIGTAYQPATDVYDGHVLSRSMHWLTDELALNRIPHIDGIYRREDLLGLSSPVSAEDCDLHTTAFVSHLHLDHMSCMGILDDRVDVYISDAAARLEAALEDVGQGVPNVRTVPWKPLYDRTPVTLGEITVLPFLLCGESYQDWSFYVTTPDVKIHYTGDLVLHGTYKDAVLSEMEYIKAQDVDILVCEATTFMDSTLNMVYGRTDVTVEPDLNLPSGMLDKCGLDQQLERILREQTGLCVFNFYQREMADVIAFSQMSRSCGRILVFEPETAYLVWKFFGEPVNVYLPDYKVFHQKQQPAWLKELLSHNTTVSREEICQAPHRYLLQNSYEYSLELLSLPAENASYLHAGGMPIGAYDPAYQNLMRILKISGFHYVTFFAKNYFSHAYPCQVKYYVDQINPHILIPSHSENPERLLPGKDGIQFIPDEGTTYLYESGHLVAESV